MKSGQITIKDIARELSISPSTVSRSLKDHPDISPGTKKAVNDLAKQLNYQPNAVALSLRKNKTNTIGVVVPEFVHYFFSTVLSGIEEVANKSGYNVLISQSHESYQQEANDIKALISHRVDGLLVSLSRETENFDQLKEIHERGIPLVFFDRICEDIDTSRVIVDDYDGAFQAVNHLVEQGCRRIAHLAGPHRLLISKNRLNGYKAALEKHGIPIDPALVLESVHHNDHLEVRKLTLSFLELSEPPDAIFANHDLVAITAMKVLKEKGLRIPQDIAMVGFSDWQMSAFVEPSLTSVSQPGFEIGQEAARLFIQQVEADNGTFKPETKIFKTRLIVRDSSKRK